MLCLNNLSENNKNTKCEYWESTPYYDIVLCTWYWLRGRQWELPTLVLTIKEGVDTLEERAFGAVIG
jgi:hypothetical protein